MQGVRASSLSLLLPERTLARESTISLCYLILWHGYQLRNYGQEAGEKWARSGQELEDTGLGDKGGQLRANQKQLRDSIFS